VLLDEIEKAHPDVFNLLLQVMITGTLTDKHRRKADFRHVIIVMTTNAGALRWRARPSASRTPICERRPGGDPRIFTPSFRNRLDAVIQFASLVRSPSSRVVDKLSSKWRRSSSRRASPSRSMMPRGALDRQGRLRSKRVPGPMARTIQEHIKRPLPRSCCLAGRRRWHVARVGFRGWHAAALQYEPTQLPTVPA